MDPAARLLPDEIISLQICLPSAPSRWWGVGIDSHPDLTHYGLYDTVVARD